MWEAYPPYATYPSGYPQAPQGHAATHAWMPLSPPHTQTGASTDHHRAHHPVHHVAAAAAAGGAGAVGKQQPLVGYNLYDIYNGLPTRQADALFCNVPAPVALLSRKPVESLFAHLGAPQATTTTFAVPATAAVAVPTTTTLGRVSNLSTPEDPSAFKPCSTGSNLVHAGASALGSSANLSFEASGEPGDEDDAPSVDISEDS
ncbi:hypothetical protein HK101_000237, partial [Irineochytrium annulatum]